METRAAHLAVGLFVLLVAACLVLFALWLGQISFRDTAKQYLINFEGSVTGLGIGGGVRYSGVPVGTVEDIWIDPDNVETIKVRVSINETTPILEGSEASLEMVGITGGTFVQITGGVTGAPPIAPPEPGELPVIPSRRSGLQQVITSLPALLDQATELVTNANAVLSPENRATITEILVNAQTMTENLAMNSDRLSDLVGQGESIAGNLDGFVVQMREDMSRISSSLDETLEILNTELVGVTDSVERLSQSFAGTADELSVLVRDIRPGLTDFSSEGLYEFTLMTAELRSLAQVVSRLSLEFERDPAQFLLGGSDRGVVPER